jgi:hypothetical protein
VHISGRGGPGYYRDVWTVLVPVRKTVIMIKLMIVIMKVQVIMIVEVVSASKRSFDALDLHLHALQLGRHDHHEGTDLPTNIKQH